ncbi:MAG: hypothetical protein KF784_08370 [Fimbriimonadaceae bacterium]|nr:hypothetical protein [Fimbriimonadaceae bacterium]
MKRWKIAVIIFGLGGLALFLRWGLTEQPAEQSWTFLKDARQVSEERYTPIYTLDGDDIFFNSSSMPSVFPRHQGPPMWQYARRTTYVVQTNPYEVIRELRGLFPPDTFNTYDLWDTNGAVVENTQMRAYIWASRYDPVRGMAEKDKSWIHVVVTSGIEQPRLQKLWSFLTER